MSDQDWIVLWYCGIWLVLALIWFLAVREILRALFPDDAGLGNDGSADPDSSSADRRDTF